MTDGTLGTVDQITPAAGANLVNFLRGQRGFENFTAGVANELYRKRDHVLGDIVDGQPVYVRAPFATYGDPGYLAFVAGNTGRTPMLYVAANDGMLHAFFAGTSDTDPQGGKEAWAIIPTSVLPNLYTLADTNYQNVHRYFVDGTPTVSDVYDGANWKTMLVGGLNDGGRSFYALDVTDPVNPKGMWEFNWDNTVCPSNPANAAGNNADCHLRAGAARIHVWHLVHS
jgi:type IV pilus assembly protein PilY1